MKKMRRKMRIGIVGAGLMGRWHAHAARQAGASVVAIADLDLDRAQRLASPFGAVAVTTASNLFQTSNIAALHICTPTHTHAQITRDALRHGAHVFIEKPLAASEDETKALLVEAERASKLICPAHQYAFQRSVNKILMRRPEAGALTSVELKFFSAGATASDADTYAAIAGDILPHSLSILHRLFPAQPLAALEWRVDRAINGEWELGATIEKTRIRILIGLLSRPTTAFLTICGTHGAFEADLFHDYVLWRGGAVSRSAKIAQPFVRSAGHLAAAACNLAYRGFRNEPAYPGLRTLISKFYEACVGGGAAPISNQQIIDAARVRDRFIAAETADGQLPTIPQSMGSRYREGGL
jgi:predicted dehydrogenase